MGPLRCCSLLAGVLLLAGFPAAQDDDYYGADLTAARTYLLKGQWARARTLFEEVLLAAEEEAEGDRPSVAVQQGCRAGLLELDLLAGKYDAVLERIDSLAAAEQQQRSLALLRGRALARRGRYQEARAAFAALLDADPRDAEARYRLGVVLGAVGEHDAARSTFAAAVEESRRRDIRDGERLAYLGQCLVELGGRANIEAASGLLVEANRIAPDRPEPLLFLGQLKFEVYREADGFRSGETDLKQVLENNGDREAALVALYRLRRSNFRLDPSRTEDYLRRALAVNPSSVPALMERGILLVDDRRFEDGAAVLDAALAVNPNDKAVLAHRAAAAHLMADAAAEADLRRRIDALDAGYADADRILADHLAALYRFVDSVPVYERALERDPELVAALDGLAKSLVYAGRGEDAMTFLSRAKELQPGYVNPWRHNAIAVQELLAKEYRMVEQGAFRFFFHRDDYAVLAEYFVPLHLEAMEQLGIKYSYQPNGLVRVETLHTWDDFSVRTIGYRGFTALGACFGPLITLVSPGDRDVRRLDFMWAATVWHEYAHVLTLGLSKSRVPRWLTEGFSVHEESARDRTWERGLDRQLFDYYHNDRIYPVAELNRAFRGPDILFGYYQGGLIVDYLAERFGFAKVVEMLTLYGEDLAQAEIFRRLYSMSPGEFDRRFREWLWETRLQHLELVPNLDDDRIAAGLAKVNAGQASQQEQHRLGVSLARRGNPIDAGRMVRLILGQDPGNGPGLLLHADLMRRRGAVAEAKETYERGFATGAEDFDSRIAFGAMLEDSGDLDGALGQYQLAKRCWPRCTDQQVAPQLRAARVLRKLGRDDDALLELSAFCSLTGRAYAPRLELARLYRSRDDRRLEARYLEEAMRIDPFSRELHELLGDAYVASGRQGEAIREYRVAVAVPAELDRANLDRKDGEPATDDDPAVRLERGKILIKLARLHRELLDHEAAFATLERAAATAPGTAVEDDAAQLRRSWMK